MSRDYTGILATVFALAALCFVACAGCARGLADPPGMVLVETHYHTRTLEQQKQMAVKVETFCPSPRIGSGVIIDRDHAITAVHVAGCRTAVARITMSDGTVVEARVVRMDYRVDVARLEVTRGSFGDVPPVDVGPTKPGGSVCVVPGDPSRALSCGTVAKPLVAHCVGPCDLHSTAKATLGNSGSAMYDRRGRMVGIVTNRHNEHGDTFATALVARPWLVKP